MNESLLFLSNQYRLMSILFPSIMKIFIVRLLLDFSLIYWLCIDTDDNNISRRMAEN